MAKNKENKPEAAAEVKPAEEIKPVEETGSRIEVSPELAAKILEDIDKAVAVEPSTNPDLEPSSGIVPFLNHQEIGRAVAVEPGTPVPVVEDHAAQKKSHHQMSRELHQYPGVHNVETAFLRDSFEHSIIVVFDDGRRIPFIHANYDRVVEVAHAAIVI